MFWLFPVLASSLLSSFLSSQLALAPTSSVFSVLLQVQFADAPLLEPDIPWPECFVPDAGPHDAVDLPVIVSLSVIPPSTTPVLLPVTASPSITAYTSTPVVTPFADASSPTDDTYTVLLPVTILLAIAVVIAAIIATTVAVVSRAVTVLDSERVDGLAPKTDTVAQLAEDNLHPQVAQTDNIVQDTSTSSTSESVADSDVGTGNLTPSSLGQSPVGTSQHELERPLSGINVNHPGITPSHSLDSEEDTDISADSSDLTENVARNDDSITSLESESDARKDAVQIIPESHIPAPKSTLHRLARPSFVKQPIAPPILASLDKDTILRDASQEARDRIETMEPPSPMEVDTVSPLTGVASREELPLSNDNMVVDDDQDKGDPEGAAADTPVKKKRRRGGKRGETARLPARLAWEAAQLARSREASEAGPASPPVSSKVEDCALHQTVPSTSGSTVLPLTGVASREELPQPQPNDNMVVDDNQDEGHPEDAAADSPTKKRRRRGGKRGDTARLPARLAWEAAQLGRSSEESETRSMSQAGTTHLTASATTSTISLLPRPRVAGPSESTEPQVPEVEIRQDRTRTESHPGPSASSSTTLFRSYASVSRPIPGSFSSRQFPPTPGPGPGPGPVPPQQRRVMIQTDALHMLGNVVQRSQSDNVRRERERLARLGFGPRVPGGGPYR